MDQGHTAGTVKSIGIAAVIMATGVAGAQATQAGAATAEPRAGTSIFGTEALPKGLTFVPWKESDNLGKLSSGPTRLVREPLKPIDPEEFRRRLKYYQGAGAE